MMAGFGCYAGSLILLLGSPNFREFLDRFGQREALALMLGVTAYLFTAGFPAGMVAEAEAEKRKSPTLLVAPTFGGMVLPMLAWFAGLEPRWPLCPLVAWVVAFAGSWTGLGIGLVLVRGWNRE